MNEVTSVVCQRLTFAHVVSARWVTWTLWCAVVATVERGASLCRAGVTCVRAVSFFASRELRASGQRASCLAASPSLREPETHTSAKLRPTSGGDCCVDPECQDSHHTAGERKHVYKTTAASPRS